MTITSVGHHTIDDNGYLTIKESDQVHILCLASDSKPAAMLQWIFNNEDVINSTEVKEVYIENNEEGYCTTSTRIETAFHVSREHNGLGLICKVTDRPIQDAVVFNVLCKFQKVRLS